VLNTVPSVQKEENATQMPAWKVPSIFLPLRHVVLHLAKMDVVNAREMISAQLQTSAKLVMYGMQLLAFVMHVHQIAMHVMTQEQG